MKIGTVLNFNESGYIMAIRAWDKLLIPINEALAFYNGFGIGLVDDEIFDLIVNGRIEKLRIKYRAAIEAQMKRAKISIAAAIEDASESADNQIRILSQKIDKINEVRNGLSTDQIQFEYVVLVMGLAVLSKEGENKIKGHFSVKIENEQQVQFCSLVKTLSDAYKEVRGFWNKYSSRPLYEGREMIGSYTESIVYEGNGQLNLDYDHLVDIGSVGSVGSVAVDQVATFRDKAPKQKTEREIMETGKRDDGPKVGDPDVFIQRPYVASGG